jgi:hypothetical protein
VAAKPERQQHRQEQTFAVSRIQIR